MKVVLDFSLRVCRPATASAILPEQACGYTCISLIVPMDQFEIKDECKIAFADCHIDRDTSEHEFKADFGNIVLFGASGDFRQVIHFRYIGDDGTVDTVIKDKNVLKSITRYILNAFENTELETDKNYYSPGNVGGGTPNHFDIDLFWEGAEPSI